MGFKTGKLNSITNSHRQGGDTTKHSPSCPMKVLANYKKSNWNKRLLLSQE